jgi:hypothetical protein
MKRLIPLLSVFSSVLTCLSASGASASVDRALGFYRVRIPATQESCAKEAENLAHRFQSMSGVPAVNPKCSATTTIQVGDKEFVIYTLDLEYPLANAPRYHEVHYGHSDALSDSNSHFYGFYSTFESCVAGIRERKAEFEKHTGLPALSASCASSQDSISRSYVLTIDNFGAQEPKQKLYTVNTANSFYFKQDLSRQITDLVLRNGGEIVGEADANIYFYSAKPFNLVKTSFGLFDDAASCASQHEAARSIVSQAVAQASYVACVNFMAPEFPKRDLIALWNGALLPYPHTFHDRYLSIQECENDKPRAIESLKTSRNVVFGAVCHPEGTLNHDPRQYTMDVYLNY